MLSKTEIGFYEKKNIILLWTIIFFIVSFFITLCFTLQNKAFYRYDGIAQHITALGYLGNYFRTIIFNFFKTGRILIPQWDFSLGLGADVITTLHYYGLGDVLNFTAIFVPLRYTETLYDILIFLRLYLSGVGFLYYARYHNFSKYASLSGAVTYVFCGFSYYCAVRHPFFINVMIYLPFILMGVDKLLEKKSCCAFVIASFLLCLSSYYFFYMVTIIVVIYAFVRFFFYVEKKTFSVFLKYFFSIAGFYFLAVGMASFIFFPNIAGFLGSSRTRFSGPIPLFYPLSYYIELFCSIISPTQSFSYTELGFSAIVLPFLILCFSIKSVQSKQIRLFTFIAVLFLSFPFFGHMFNGFNYVTNRWCFTVAFLIGILLADVIDNFSTLDFNKQNIAFILSLILSLLVISASFFSLKIRTHLLLSYLFLFCLSLLFVIPYTRKYFLYKQFILGVCVFSVIINVFVKYSPRNLNYLSDFFEKGSTREYLNNEVDVYLSNLDPNSDFCRIDEDYKTYYNASSIFGYYDTFYYWSQNNSCLSDFYEQLAVCTGKNLSLAGVNRRTYIQDLLNIKYILAHNTSDNVSIPFDTKRVTQKGNNIVYERQTLLPFGFTYKNIIPKKQINKFNALEKQIVLMQAAVVESDNVDFSSITNKEEYDFSSLSTVKFNIKPETGLEIKGNTINVFGNNAILKIEFDSIFDKEVYLELQNLIYENDYNEAVKIIYEPSVSSCSQDFEIPIGHSDRNHDFLLCSGCLNTNNGYFILRFPEKGMYSFSNINVYELDLSNRKSYIEELSINYLQNLKIGTNFISGNISVDENKVLCLSMPYSFGWKCFVDGRKVPVYKINFMLSGIYLEKGIHELQFIYSTPFLKIGFLISIFAFIILVILLLFPRINYRWLRQKK